jgi:aspartyl-tRNA(Asn)/glutamyl-tRNA(Gln) amidotransferase subunit A
VSDDGVVRTDPGMAQIDLRRLSTDLAERTVDAREVTEQCLARIGLRNGTVNAFVAVDEARARQAAQAAHERLLAGKPLSELDGVPVAIKDNLDVMGLPTSNGIRAGEPAKSDAASVARLRAAGAVILGKLNMHEAALGTTTDNPHFGRTHNPLRHGFTPGGSSGGSSAAVADGMCALALGTDTMGSVRLPAAYCGIYGFKPSRGMIPNDGLALLEESLDCIGPLTTSIEGLAAAFGILSGQGRRLGSTSDTGRGKPLRVGILGVFDTMPLEGSVATAWARVRDGMSDSFEFDRIPLECFDASRLRRACLIVIEYALARELGVAQRTHISPELEAMVAYGERVTSEQLADANDYLDAIRQGGAQMFDTVDCIVSPVAPVPPFPFEWPAPPGLADFMGLANVLGLPAVSLPAGLSTDGLPIGIQIMGKASQDVELLSAASKIDKWIVKQR